jgi:PAS domain S-box-containing protein
VFLDVLLILKGKNMNNKKEPEKIAKSDLNKLISADSEHVDLQKDYFLEKSSISQIVFDLLNLTSESEILGFIGEKIKEMLGEAYIILSEYDESFDSLKVHSIYGINPTILKLSKKIVGKEIFDFSFPLNTLDAESRAFLSNGKLHEIENGINFITAGKIPLSTAHILEKKFGIKKTYLMSFSWQNEMFGSANIFTKKGTVKSNLKNVETFLNIASVALKRRKAEKELEDRERLLRLVTDNMLNLVAHVDKDGKFMYVSPSVKNLLGYEVDEVLGKNVFEFMELTHPDDIEKVMSTFIDDNQTYKPGNVQHRFKCADNHYMWINSSGNPLFDSENKYNGVVFSMTDIDSIKNTEEKYKSSLHEKELILRELHHRVKNNMQIISSLLSLQAKSLKDERDLEIFKSSQSRVKSMALIHEKLYDSPDFSHINLADYIQSLVEELYDTYNIRADKIHLKINIHDIKLNMETSIPLGLLINEIVSNSLKYAFPENENFENPKLVIELKKEKNDYILMIMDNGIGIHDKLDLEKSESLGMQLINSLTEQVDGKLKLDTSHGTKFTIKFGNQKYQKRV